MTQLIIHAGIHRTGTTALQAYLAKTRKTLLERGVSYPGKDNNHQRWAWGLRSAKVDGTDFADFLKSGARDTVIISGEDFCTHRDLGWLDVLAGLFGHIEVHFVLRRQDEWLQSWYNQHVRWPFEERKSTMTPMEFLGTIEDYYWLDYQWLGELWAGKIGADNVHMHPMGQDSMRRLLKSIASDLDKEEPKRAVNQSIAPEHLEIVRHLDMGSLRPGQRMKLIAALANLDSGEGNPRSIYPPAVKRMIIKLFSQTNQIAFARYGRGEARGFSDEVADAELYEPGLPDSAELLRDIIAPILRKIA